MSLNIKPYLFILCGVVLLFILFGLLRNFFFPKQLIAWTDKNQTTLKAIVLAMFLVFVGAAVPVFIKVFVNMQIRVGNGDLGMVRCVRNNAMTLIYTVWIVFGLGLAIALPVMIKNGLFSNNP